jgi:cephalosporin hydroxylase
LRHVVDDSTFTITSDGGKAVSWFDDAGFAMMSRWWTQASWQRQYSYQFQWLGRPIIQLPTDVIMMQDLIYRLRPTVIIETGIAHGGSAVLHASLLTLVHGQPKHQRPHVVAIDIEIRPHNRTAIDAHPLRPTMTLIEGSSTDPNVAKQARDAIRPEDVVLVILDSNHTKSHVLAELNAYAPLVTPGSAIVAMDGVMRDLATLPKGTTSWASDNPCEAVAEFLKTPLGKGFEIDRRYEPYALTHSPDGLLMRKKAGDAE